MSTRGWEQVTQRDVTARELARQRATMPQKARSKYRAVRTTVNGFTFDSKAEAARYLGLMALGLSGYLRNLELQPWWYLTVDDGVFPGAGKVIIGKYIADFRYEQKVLDQRGEHWEDVIEDVKGWRTLPIARWKIKHVEAQYGITIQEVR